MLGVVPSMVGVVPSMVGAVPSMVGVVPRAVGVVPSMVGAGPGPPPTSRPGALFEIAAAARQEGVRVAQQESNRVLLFPGAWSTPAGPWPCFALLRQVWQGYYTGYQGYHTGY